LPSRGLGRCQTRPEPPAPAMRLARTRRRSPCLHSGSSSKRFLTAISGGCALLRGKMAADTRSPAVPSARFSRKVRNRPSSGVAIRLGGSYFKFRRGTKPQRARPPRCEAAPPDRKGPRARPGRFLKGGLGPRLFSSVSARPSGASRRGRCRCDVRRRYTASSRSVVHPKGTTGFDVVGSCGWLRVEVPGGLVKHPGKP
jgi:hypothetical protein